MRIINRYLIREVLLTFLAVTPILMLIFLSNRFIYYLTEAAVGKFPGDIVFTLLGFKSISILPLVLPLVFYLSVVLGLGRLYKDSEMVVLAASGTGPGRVFRIILAPALVLAVIVAGVSLYLGPWASNRSQQVKNHADTSAEINTVVSGRFQESRKGDHIFYTETLSRDGHYMDDVFIQSRQHGKLNILSSAQGAKFIDKKSGDQYVMLQNGTRYELDPEHLDYKVVNYGKYYFRLESKDPEAGAEADNVKTTEALWRSSEPNDIAELQWRISMPVSAITLALLAVLLARTTPRQGRYGKLFIAILVYVIYNNILGVARSWVEHGVVKPLIGMWWVHALSLLIILILLLGQVGLKRRMPRKKLSPA